MAVYSEARQTNPYNALFAVRWAPAAQDLSTACYTPSLPCLEEEEEAKSAKDEAAPDYACEEENPNKDSDST